MSLKKYIETMLPEVEKELKGQVSRLDEPRTLVYQEMITYHMGWTGEGAGPEATGKRVRPLLLLLTTAACAAEWKSSLPAAAAIELVHNFSLVHDDVQDNSGKRRGRRTVWTIWGVPMAINVGDGLFVLSNQAIMDLSKFHPPSTVVLAATILHETCLELTRGQFLDMSYEKKTDLSVEDYWPMIGGKTSALLSACTHIGSLLGNADEAARTNYRLFGYHLGLAFQIQDDILGIWGNENVTGKSAASDLLEQKKSLPVLFGLEKKKEFAERWLQGPIRPEEVRSMADCLEEEGGREYAEEMSATETRNALCYLNDAGAQGIAGEALLELANKLVRRDQ